MRGATNQAERREMYTTQMATAEKLIESLGSLDLRQTRNYLDAFLQDFVTSISTESVSSTTSARVFQAWWNKNGGDSDIRTFIREQLVPAMRAWAVAITASGSLQLDDGTKLDLPSSAVRSLARIENLARRSFVPVTMTMIVKWELEGDNRSDLHLDRNLKAVETFVARSILSGKPSSPFRGTAVRASTIAREGTDGDGLTIAEWLKKQSESDSSVRRAVLQSVARDDGSDPSEEEDWVVRRDLAKRVSSSAFAALIDGMACQLEGEDHVLPLMLPPGAKWTKAKKLEIEHLYPQSSSRWQEDLKDWGTTPERMDRRLHSLGNTTVLPRSANAKSRNLPLSEKQEILKRDKVPNFQVSDEFFNADQWTHETIDARTVRLCEAAIRFWDVNN